MAIRHTRVDSGVTAVSHTRVDSGVTAVKGLISILRFDNLSRSFKFAQKCNLIFLIIFSYTYIY